MVSICAKIVFSQNCRDVKNEVFAKKIAVLFLAFLVAARETEKWKKAPKPYNNSVFMVVIQK